MVNLKNSITATKELCAKIAVGIRAFFTKFGLLLCISLLVIALGTVSYLAYTLNTNLTQTRQDLQNKSANLENIETLLSQTEEGRKQLESLNQSLDKKATSAQKEADKANDQLDDANKELKAQEAKLAQVNAQLAKAKRGIALFDSARSYYNQFVSWTGKSIGYIVTIQSAVYEDDQATIDATLPLLNTSLEKVQYYDSKLNGVFSKLKSGKY